MYNGFSSYSVDILNRWTLNILEVKRMEIKLCKIESNSFVNTANYIRNHKKMIV